jgi:KaiC/GvpD/RAD55 family RecA-like ATPase
MTLLLPVFEHARLTAYPSDDAPECTYASLHDVLTEPADSDAHFACYSAPELPYRLKREVLKERPVTMVLFCFDVDDPVAHAQHIPAREEWRALEQPKIDALIDAHKVFAYETRGGYRIVGRLPEPFTIANAEDEATWTAWYKTNVKALKRVFGIEADTACADWQRLFRLPKATRDGAPQQFPTYGDPNATLWDLEPTEEDFVEPEEARDTQGARTIERTEPPLPIRKVKALAHVAKMKPSVQGAGAENTLWAVCNAALVGFDLPVEDAVEVIRTAHMPLSTLEHPGPEHFLDRAYKKLWELDSTGGEQPWGHLLMAERLADKVREKAAEKAQKKLPKDSGGVSPQSDVWPSPTELLERAMRDIAVKHPTPLETLNTATRGGLRAKSILILGGAPGAGKTTLAVQLGAHYVEQGVPVVIMAADEAIELLLTRMAQRHGIMREDIEQWRPHAAKRWAEITSPWPLLAVDAEEPDATLEQVAERLSSKGAGVMIVDSLQTVRSDTSHEADNPRARLDDVVLTLKQVAKRYGHIVIATSELSRGAYRSKNAADQIDDLAAFKESGGIEYAMTVGLVLRTPAGEGGIVNVSTAKNRLGGGKPKFRLQLDPARATFREE